MNVYPLGVGVYNYKKSMFLPMRYLDMHTLKKILGLLPGRTMEHRSLPCMNLTSSTTPYEGIDIRINVGPPAVLSRQSHHLCNAGVVTVQKPKNLKMKRAGNNDSEAAENYAFLDRILIPRTGKLSISSGI